MTLGQGFIQWGGELPPPKKEREKKKRERRERERERERKRERGGGGRGACIFLRRSASDQYSPLLHDSILRALDKTM